MILMGSSPSRTDLSRPMDWYLAIRLLSLRDTDQNSFSSLVSINPSSLVAKNNKGKPYGIQLNNPKESRSRKLLIVNNRHPILGKAKGESAINGAISLVYPLWFYYWSHWNSRRSWGRLLVNAYAALTLPLREP